MNVRDGDAELDRLLRLADPGPAEAASGGDLDSIVGEIGRAVMSADAPATAAARTVRRRGRWSLAAIVGVVAALLTATTAVAYAAVTISARTGEYGRGGQTENDASEWLRSDGVDFRQVVEGLRPTEVPVPQGYSYTADVEAFIAVMAGDPASVQVTGVQGSYAFWAVCAWEKEWLAADDAGDGARRAAATATLLDVPSWPLIVKTHTVGSLGHRRSLAEAAVRGDAPALRRDVELSCSPYPSKAPR